MSITTGTFPGVRIVDMPDLGAISDTSSVVGERAGSGRFSAAALRGYIEKFPVLGAVSIAQFGAMGDSATDNLGAFNAAIAALPFGGAIVIPPGDYVSSGPIVLPFGVSLRGSGRGASTLTMACNANPNITMNTSCEISGLQIVGRGTQTGAMVLMQGNGGVLRDFTMQNYFGGILIQGASSSALAVGATIQGGNMFNPIVGGVGIGVDNFGGCMILDMVMAGPASGPQPAASFVIKNGDTLLLDNINATHHGPFLVEPPASNNTYALMITNCLFDSNYDSSAASFLPAGNIIDTVITNTWFGLSHGHGLVLSPTATGVISGMEVTGCQFIGNTGGSGININATGGAIVTGINIMGGRAEANSSNGAHLLGTGVLGVTFNGFRAGNYGGRGPNGGAGILTAGSVDRYVITNCSLWGNTGAALADTSTGTNKTVANNMVA